MARWYALVAAATLASCSFVAPFDEAVECRGRRFYRDQDGDGHGCASSFVCAAIAPTGMVTNHDDCNDTDRSVHPGAAEVCNGVDDNCAGGVDEGGLDNTCRGSGASVLRAVCRGGGCVVTCSPGRGHCDADPANGCETDTTTSWEHCGACGRRCGVGARCVNGLCEGVVLEIAAGRHRASGSSADLDLFNHTCALRSPSTGSPAQVVCWGSNRYGQLGRPYAVTDDGGPAVVGLNPAWEVHAVATGGGAPARSSGRSVRSCAGDVRRGRPATQR